MFSKCKKQLKIVSSKNINLGYRFFKGIKKKMKSIFKQFDVILSADYSKAKSYLPTDRLRRDSCQGWNEEAKNYLLSLGYDDKVISQFYLILSNHVHGANVNESMRVFVKNNPGFIEDISAFEVAAMRERYEIKLEEALRDLENKQLEIEIGIPEWMRPEDKEFFMENLKSDFEYMKRNFERLKENAKNPPMYRKGDNNKIVLSWTYDRDGATFSGKNSDGEYSYRLAPNNSSSVDELISNGIYPVVGFGAFVNFYGEKEIIFVNMNLIN